MTIKDNEKVFQCFSQENIGTACTVFQMEIAHFLQSYHSDFWFIKEYFDKQNFLQDLKIFISKLQISIHNGSSLSKYSKLNSFKPTPKPHFLSKLVYVDTRNMQKISFRLD